MVVNLTKQQLIDSWNPYYKLPNWIMLFIYEYVNYSITI